MPKKCESCRFYHGRIIGQPGHDLDVSTCVQINTPEPIDEARYICDREGDGVFVYFEPKEPNAGAVATPDFGIPNSRGIDDRWRSGSDYPMDTPLKMEASI